MLIPVESVLFRRVKEINVRALRGEEKGQYHVTLTAAPDLSSFAREIPETDPTANGGWTRLIPLEPFLGSTPVPASSLKFRFMGPRSQRRDYNFAGQSSAPYPLWAEGRAFTSDADATSISQDVIIVIRDVSGKYHARWIRAENVSALPAGIATRLEHDEAGVFHVAPSNAEQSADVSAVIRALREHKNVLLYGPPGTGKTRLLTEVVQRFGTPRLMIDTEDEGSPFAEVQPEAELQTSWTTFHQSYSYEDFVIGLRPSLVAARDGLSLDLVPGTLLEAAEWARGESRESLLIVDEINRGNVSRIFGEFITLMEPDKRLADDGSETATTVSVSLPYVKGGEEVELPNGEIAKLDRPFTMPARVYTLATMNSVDKSVAPLDAALRRRFHVLPMFPDTAVITEKLGIALEPSETSAHDAPTSDEIKRDAVLALEALNKHITMFLGQDFQFGHWFLAPLIGIDEREDAANVAATIWSTSILPQLEEYFAGRSEQFKATLGPAAFNSPALSNLEPTEDQIELGAELLIRGNRHASSDDIVGLLAAIAKNQ